jgi:hypothetical protein
MAIGVLFDFPGVTQAQYDATLKALKPGGRFSRLSDWPTSGVLFHVAGPTPGGWRVVDVWESEADFRRFGEVLMPILKSLGFPEGTPSFFPVHNMIKD